MAPAAQLPLIDKKPLPQREGAAIWINDVESYRLLANRHDELASWVSEKCK